MTKQRADKKIKARQVTRKKMSIGGRVHSENGFNERRGVEKAKTSTGETQILIPRPVPLWISSPRWFCAMGCCCSTVSEYVSTVRRRGAAATTLCRSKNPECRSRACMPKCVMSSQYPTSYEGCRRVVPKANPNANAGLSRAIINPARSLPSNMAPISAPFSSPPPPLLFFIFSTLPRTPCHPSPSSS
jgi:hypothetical protein